MASPEGKRGDIIGGFPDASPDCKGCGQPLKIENAWMTDGCPCNSALGINSLNETRWRLLMELQQTQSRELESKKGRIVTANFTLILRAYDGRITGAAPGDPERDLVDSEIAPAQQLLSVFAGDEG